MQNKSEIPGIESVVNGINDVLKQYGHNQFWYETKSIDLCFTVQKETELHSTGIDDSPVFLSKPCHICHRILLLALV